MKVSIRALARHIPFVRFLARRLRGNNLDIYREKIASESHNSILLTCDGVPLPPIRLRDMVRQGAILAEDFVLEGRQVHQLLLQVAAETGEPITTSTQLFEFGVGCGRVARHFLADGAQNFIGSDVDGELIDWCEKNLSASESVRFFRNGYQPPLLIDAASCDLVYAISVFTHMNVDSQKSWAEEMGRVVRPGGRLLVSFLERPKSDLPKGIDVRERTDREYLRVWLGEEGAPVVYFNTYNSKEYFMLLFSENFESIAYREKIVRNLQSMLIMQRR